MEESGHCLQKEIKRFYNKRNDFVNGDATELSRDQIVRIEECLRASIQVPLSRMRDQSRQMDRVVDVPSHGTGAKCRRDAI